MGDNYDFIEACRNGSFDLVKSFIEQDVPVNSADDEGNSTLAICCALGNEEITKYLIAKGASLDHPNAYGWTPLMHASRNGNEAIVRLLIQCNASVNSCNAYGATALHCAVRGGHSRITEILLNSDADPGQKGHVSPLSIAALHGFDSCVRSLNLRLPDPQAPDMMTKSTPLMLAALSGSFSTVQLLTELGHDANVMNLLDMTALDLAASCSHNQVCEYLKSKTTRAIREVSEKKSTPESDMFDACRIGDTQRVRRLLKGKLRLSDCRSPEGATPLMFAAMNGHLDTVQDLVRVGADINAQDSINGWTCLMQAAFHGRRLVVEYLLENGADASIRASNGCTVFDMASLIDDIDVEILRLLATAHANAKPSSQRDVTQTNQGVRAWFSRVGQKFKNLKTTFRKGNKLTPTDQTQRGTGQQVGLKTWYSTYTLDQIQFHETMDDKSRPGTALSSITSSASYASQDRLYPMSAFDQSLANSQLTMPEGKSVKNTTMDIVPIYVKPIPERKAPLPRGLSMLELSSPYSDSTSSNPANSSQNSESLSDLSSSANGNSKQTSSSSDRTIVPVVEDDLPRQEDLSALLSRLSLEQYKPIFDVQEVDMEAFLALDAADLEELGIYESEPRRKLLAAISELRMTSRGRRSS